MSNIKKIIFAIAILTFGVSIAQTNIVKEGYYQVIVSDTVYSQHSDQANAIETLINLRFANHESNARMTSPTYRVDLDIPSVQCDTVFIDNEQGEIVNSIVVGEKEYKVSEIEAMLLSEVTDTIVVTECFEDYNDKIWLWDNPNHVWIPFKETGLSHVKVDSMPDWKKILQNKYRLERTKSHVDARTEYKELDMPFQFMHDSIASIGRDQVRMKVFASEDWYPMFYVDDQLWKDGSAYTSGYQDFYGYDTRRHTCTFNDLLPNTEYTLKIVGKSRIKDEEDVIYYQIKTLP